MVRSVADADFVRRQNRGLVLSTLRRLGPMSRTQLAGATGLSHASITAIGGELISQRILVDSAETPPARTRGRPAVHVAFNRRACFAAVVELDVNRARFSLADYAGTLVDRTESPVTNELFLDQPAAGFIIRNVNGIVDRNPETIGRLGSISVSVQGMLDRDADGLAWSPIAHVSGQSIVRPVREALGVTTSLHKRGRLLAEGTRLLYPELGERGIAAVFIGSTVAMGLSLPGSASLPDAGATEFGHMNHIVDGARCRCGMRGCVEAYAADYGVLRTAYGVPDQVPPAASVPASAYQELIHLARTGRRNAVHAFNVAGRAIGFGLSRLMTISAPAHVVITGPGASAFELMRAEIEAALKGSLVCRINGPPGLTVHHDEREPIFQGMLMNALNALDQSFFAAIGGDVRLNGVAG
ncbi:MAG TPA: ROK family protein [Alphaproteobacteria bacterium]|nr:ROK family protein [Alphaproteobacteria bacterium]